MPPHGFRCMATLGVRYCVQALLTVHHLKSTIVVEPQNQGLQAIELFRLEVFSLREIADVLQQLCHLLRLPSVCSAGGKAAGPLWRSCPSDLSFIGDEASLEGSSTAPLHTAQLSRRTNPPRRSIPLSPPLSEGRGSLHARKGFLSSRKSSLLRPSPCCHRQRE